MQSAKPRSASSQEDQRRRGRHPLATHPECFGRLRLRSLSLGRSQSILFAYHMLLSEVNDKMVPNFLVSRDEESEIRAAKGLASWHEILIMRILIQWELWEF